MDEGKSIIQELWRYPSLQKALLYIIRLVPDRLYIEKMFKRKLGYRIDLDNPQSFNEKLNWLKLYNRNPFYSKMADKYAVKEFVAERIGDEYVVDNYGCWDSFDEINFDKLPSQFVLKCTHDSSGVTICRDKTTFDKEAAKKKINKSKRLNFSFVYREWPYKNIKPRIIADRLLDDGSGHELRDYKFWCFNGVPTFMYCTNKADDIFENFYDMDFNPVEIDHGFRRNVPEFEKPSEFDLMKSLCKKLLSGIDIPFVRVDFFDVEGHVFFGEFTFYDWGGMRPFKDVKQDYWLGSMIKMQ